MQSRREFLRRSAFVSLSPVAPTFLTNVVSAGAEQVNGRRLVVIQLDGGNDGINTVVPYRDDGYEKHRQELRLAENDLIKANDNFAFHPRLRGVAELFEAGKLSVVHGVGYPNPNRSHFESTAIWQSGSTVETERRVGHGWIGSAVDATTSSGPHAIHVGDETLPVALRGRRCTANTISNPADLRLRMPFPLSPRIEETRLQTEASLSPPLNLKDFVTQCVTEAYASASELASTTRVDSAVNYPNSRLATRLKLISQMIKSGSAAQVYYTVQPGYDTHASQLPEHASLLSEFSRAVTAFMEDLKQSGLADCVTILAFSEFGRRVQENASGGTDHGTAGPVFLVGNQLLRSSIGEVSRLDDLHQGDLKYSIDFRSIYRSVLVDWLGLDCPAVLNGYPTQQLFS